MTQSTDHYLNQSPAEVNAQLAEIDRAIADLCSERQWPAHLLVLSFVRAAGAIVRQSTPDAEMPQAAHVLTAMLHEAMRVRTRDTMQ